MTKKNLYYLDVSGLLPLLACIGPDSLQIINATLLLKYYGEPRNSHFRVVFLKSDAKNRDIVFCFQNCSDLVWEKIVLVIKKKILKFKAEVWEFAKICPKNGSSGLEGLFDFQVHDAEVKKIYIFLTNLKMNKRQWVYTNKKNLEQCIWTVKGQ